MFKEILRLYLKESGISQEDVASQIGDTQQAISDFLNNDGNPQRKTREKYFEKLKGFKAYFEDFDKNLLQENRLQENNSLNEPSNNYNNDPFPSNKPVSQKDIDFVTEKLEESFDVMIKDKAFKKEFVFRASEWVNKLEQSQYCNNNST